jgi:hypothetical protein
VTIEHVAVINWTQDFSLLDPVTDVVYGIDPAVTTWIDKGTSLTNLTQTTVANQADLVAGEMVFNGDDFYDGVEAQAGSWSYYFEVDFTRVLGSTSTMLRSSIQGNISKLADDTIRIRSEQASNQTMPDYVVTGGLKKLLIIKNPTHLLIYENGLLVSSKTYGASTFSSYNTLGWASASLNSEIKAFKVIDRALTDQEAIAETT